MNRKTTASTDSRLKALIIAATTAQAPGGIAAILNASRLLAHMRDRPNNSAPPVQTLSEQRRGGEVERFTTRYQLRKFRT